MKYVSGDAKARSKFQMECDMAEQERRKSGYKATAGEQWHDRMLERTKALYLKGCKDKHD